MWTAGWIQQTLWIVSVDSLFFDGFDGLMVNQTVTQENNQQINPNKMIIILMNYLQEIIKNQIKSLFQTNNEPVIYYIIMQV